MSKTKTIKCPHCVYEAITITGLYAHMADRHGARVGAGVTPPQVDLLAAAKRMEDMRKVGAAMFEVAPPSPEPPTQCPTCGSKSFREITWCNCDAMPLSHTADFTDNCKPCPDKWHGVSQGQAQTPNELQTRCAELARQIDEKDAHIRELELQLAASERARQQIVSSDGWAGDRS